MSGPLDKICIQTRCGWKSHCDLYFKSSRELHRMTILPEMTADACPHYAPMQPHSAWGDGPEAND